ncbi:hypothetical protein WA556_001379, partial [Blastocystis sp. ATCC 50177/Nand II]
YSRLSKPFSLLCSRGLRQAGLRGGYRFYSHSVSSTKTFWRSSLCVATALGGFGLYYLYSSPHILADEEQNAPKSPFMDCGDPSCHDKQEMFRMATEAVSKKAVKQPAAYTKKENEFTVRDEKGNLHECPPTRELLGRHSWTLLHSIAAYYPDNPSEEDKKYAREFLESFAHLYPCKTCRAHLQKSMQKYPPKVDSRKDFMLYLCTLHNIVNRTLLKPVYPCNIELLEERWHTGCAECWSSGNKEKMTAEDSMNCKDMKMFGLSS